MGKIRIKTIGEEEIEKKQHEDAEKRRQIKKQKKAVSVGEDIELAKTAEETQPEVHAEEKKAKKSKTEKKSTVSKKSRGSQYTAASKLVDKSKTYSLADAVDLLKKASYARFDETVEIHVNLSERNVKGEVTFPHGTGKKVRVVIADDKVVSEIENGTINFDILIATPSFMPKLVPLARTLGPKGLMPNPKNGTVVDDPEKAVTKFSSGSVQYKSESKFPLLHMGVGKVSFETKHIVENIQALIASLNKKNIAQIALSTTMGPSVKISVE